MSDYTRERDAARRYGFARPRPRLPVVPESDGVQPARSVVDRLGVRPNARVALVGVSDSDLPALVAQRTKKITKMVPHEPVDMIIYQAEGSFALQRISELARLLARPGSLWVLWPRGQEHIKQSHVHRAGIAAGMLDVRMASVSERLSGMEFVHRR